MIRIILNGKKAHVEDVRSAILSMRKDASMIEVRVTYEQGDAIRLVREAARDNIARIVAAGGDGTLNEVVNGLAEIEREMRPELAVLPLGTANDFASACRIPQTPAEALHLAVHGKSVDVDIARANDRYFINVATGGFASQATADVPVQLKNFLGGGAYAIAAVIKSLNFNPAQGRLQAENIELEGSAIIGAICNCRQAGGGQVLAPDALINDGLLDVMIVLTFPLSDMTQVIQEIRDPSTSGRYVKRFRSRWIDSWPNIRRSVNLDGEPYEAEHIRFEVLPKEIKLVLPEECPCIIR